MASVHSVQLTHPRLNTTFKGVRHPVSNDAVEVEQYRGIKYATIPLRFRRSHLLEAYSEVTDATKFGPIAPQNATQRIERFLYTLPEELIPQEHHKQSEFECLNLNITRPQLSPDDSASGRARLPVMIWIHGGGNNSGSGSDWMCDGGPLVKKSVELKKPIIIVSFNYRIGLLGFGASGLLKEDNASAGEEGVGNYGFHDQYNAFLWVHKNIEAFGGDPNNVTLFGGSWGAADIHCHLLSKWNEAAVTTEDHPVLFHRAILQSGAITPATVQTVSTAGSLVHRIMSALNITTVDQLRNVSPDKIVKLTGERVRPVDDGTWFRDGWKSLDFAHPNARVIQDIVIGDCGQESVLWEVPAALWTSESVVRRARAIIQSVYKADALLREYEIDGHVDEDEIKDRVMDIINDAHFAWPVEVAAQAAVTGSRSRSSSPATEVPHPLEAPPLHRGGPYVYRYIFDQASPYTDTAHHSVDLLYLFGTVAFPTDPEFTEEENAEINWDKEKVRDSIQAKWIGFAYGQAPWTAVGKHDPSPGISPALSASSSTSEISSVPTPHNGLAVQQHHIVGDEGFSTSGKDKIFVFGPEGETGERSRSIFEGRRRVRAWRDAFEPLGVHIIQKMGNELGNGPPEKILARG